MRTLILLCGLVCGATAALRAQEPSLITPIPTPSEPFLEKAPDFAQWTITSRTVEPEAKLLLTEETAKSPLPSPNITRSRRSGKTEAEVPESKPTPSQQKERKVVVTKTKTIRYERITDKGVDDIVRWCLPGIQITIQQGGPAVVALPGESPTSSYVDHSQTDFEGFEWISPNNFKGTEQVNGQECYVFRGKARATRDPASALVEKVACINVDTQMPVTLQENDELQTFHFEIAPIAMLKLPPDVMTRVEEWKKSIQQSELMPSKP